MMQTEWNFFSFSFSIPTGPELMRMRKIRQEGEAGGLDSDRQHSQFFELYCLFVLIDHHILHPISSLQRNIKCVSDGFRKNSSDVSQRSIRTKY
jgi:hypothetical protein